MSAREHFCDDCLERVQLELSELHCHLVVRIRCPNCGTVSKKRPVDPVPHVRVDGEFVPVEVAL